jgi:hypothetical protein
LFLVSVSPTINLEEKETMSSKENSRISRPVGRPVSKTARKPRVLRPLSEEELSRQVQVAITLFEQQASIVIAASLLKVPVDTLWKWIRHPQARRIHLKVWDTKMQPLKEEFYIVTGRALDRVQDDGDFTPLSRTAYKRDLKKVDDCARRLTAMGKRIEKLHHLATGPKPRKKPMSELDILRERWKRGLL